MDLLFILVLIFVAHFVKAFAEQSGSNYYYKRKKRTTKSPGKRSGSRKR